MIRKLYRLLTTDGPGHTEYPEVDIAAHRSIARAAHVLGLVVVAVITITGYVWPAANSIYAIGAAIVFLGITQWVRAMFRLEALEWEVELLRGEREE